MSFDAPLHVLDNAALPSVDGAAFQSLLASDGPAATLWRHGVDADASDAQAILGGEVARWPFDRAPPSSDSVAVCLARDVLHFPGFGVVVQRTGELTGGVHLGPSGETLHRWPDLAGLPNVRVEEGGPRLVLDAAPPAIARAALFMPWGANFNYGHFVLDALPALLALEEAGALDGTPVIAPPLTPWQRGLLELAFPGLDVRELTDPVVRIDTALYATCMNHFLHGPDALVGRLAARVRAAVGGGVGAARRVYLSRRGQSMRVMLGEAQLEAALARRGFAIVQPEKLSAREQVELMSGAEVVVGPTGAGMANALFLPLGARVVEIQPENFASRWLWAACRQAGVEWRGYVCRSPAPPWRAPMARLRRGFKFAYAPPLDDLLSFVDEAL